VPTALSRMLARAAAAAVLAVAVAVTVAGCGSGGATLGSAGQVHLLSLVAPSLGATTPTPGQLYRIVGCRSSGTIAYSHGPHRYEVAIGFDDGPDQDTPSFVTMLARNHATATFFLIGDQITPAYRPTMRRELREGDVIGDHTYTHPYLTRTGEVHAQLQRTIAAIYAQTGYTPCVFRPPYGAYDSSVLQTARSLGLATIMWNVDPSDYAQPGTATIVHRVLSEVQPGSIVISHDGGGPRGQTLAAYPQIIAALRRRGFGIVTIPQLLGFHPVYEPCVRLCDGLGVPRGKVPHEAIIQPAP
jgi:peptidoglycan-N-acetylglucosamine deacetylase